MVDAITNAAIPGALVNLTTAAMSTTTNVYGAFTFLKVPSGQHTLVTSAAGYQSDTRAILVPPQAPLRIALCPVGSPICESPGLVVGASIGPLF